LFPNKKSGFLKAVFIARNGSVLKKLRKLAWAGKKGVQLLEAAKIFSRFLFRNKSIPSFSNPPAPKRRKLPRKYNRFQFLKDSKNAST
jgi:hypothetical protein